MQFTFFDFDGTLTFNDSFTGFIRHVHGWHGLALVLLKSAPAIILWKAGLRSNTYAKLRMFGAAFRGMTLKEFKEKGESYAEKIERITRNDIVDALARSVKEGRNTVIVSASMGDWIRPWAARHGVNIVLATEPEVDSTGKLTGRFKRPNCQREEKVKRIIEAFPELERDREAHTVTAYGDSDGDFEMLAFADNPVKINKRQVKTTRRPDK